MASLLECPARGMPLLSTITFDVPRDAAKASAMAQLALGDDGHATCVCLWASGWPICEWISASRSQQVL
jgi:hypothetical protein